MHDSLRKLPRELKTTLFSTLRQFHISVATSKLYKNHLRKLSISQLISCDWEKTRFGNKFCADEPTSIFRPLRYIQNLVYSRRPKQIKTRLTRLRSDTSFRNSRQNPRAFSREWVKYKNMSLGGLFSSFSGLLGEGEVQ